MDHSVFVGDLAPEVTDQSLQDEFRQFFPSVRGAKVISDMVTNRSKGYGFVRFGDEEERNRAIAELQVWPTMGHAKLRCAAFRGTQISSGYVCKQRPGHIKRTCHLVFCPASASCEYHTVSEARLRTGMCAWYRAT